MNDHALPNPSIQRNIVTMALFLIFWTLATVILWSFARVGLPALVVLLTLVAVFIWTFFGGEYWWHLPPLAFVFGGLFYYGFRIKSFEIGFVLAFLPLFLLVAAGRRIETQRGRLPWAIWPLVFLLSAWLVASVYITLAWGGSGAGNILRVYIRGLWGPIFALVFWWFGSTQSLRRLISAMYIVVIARSLLGIVGYFSPRLLFIPLLNFVLPSVHAEGVDLRETALFLVMLALVNFRLSAKQGWRMFHALMALISVWLVLIGGSRVSMAALFVVFIFYFIFRKRFVILATVLCAFGLLVVFLNTQPQFLARQDARVIRTLSILVADAPTHNLHESVRGSDEWHILLKRLGFVRWTEGPFAFLLGRRIEGFDTQAFHAESVSVEERVDIAASVGSYESGLLTVLGAVGLVGALLYAAFFISAGRELLPDLWRHGIDSVERGVAFMALSMLGYWTIFSWIAGHFPTFEIVMTAIALAAHRQRAASLTDAPVGGAA